MALTACYMYNSHIDKVNLLKVIDVKAKSGISLKLFVNILENIFIGTQFCQNLPFSTET